MTQYNNNALGANKWQWYRTMGDLCLYSTCIINIISQTGVPENII